MERDSLLTKNFLIVTVATFAYFMAVGVMIPALPHFVERPVGGGSAAVGLAVGMFSVAAVMTRPFIGGIGDRRGRRGVVVVGALVVARAGAPFAPFSPPLPLLVAVRGVPLVVAGAVALFALSSHSLTLLVVLRAVQGIGEAGFYVGAATLITDIAPPHRRGEAVSYFSVALYLGLALGPSLSEAVLDDTHYGRGPGLVCVFALLVSGLSRAAPEIKVRGQEPRPPTRIVLPAALVPGAVLGLGILAYAAFAAFVPLYVDDIGA